MLKKGIVIAIMFTIIMIGSAFAISIVSDNGLNQSTSVDSGSVLSSNVEPLTSSSSTPWTMPTTTQEEPGYTNGTFNVGIDCNVNNLNVFQATTLCDGEIMNEVYSFLCKPLPNGQIVPWLATNYTVQHVTKDNSTFDIETNSYENYSYIYTINLRPYVQWTDWSKANASDTYVFHNKVDYYFNGTPTSHVYSSYKNTTMRTYYLQSADVILTWRMEASIGDWPNVVNMVPNGNLSVNVYLTQKSIAFVDCELASNRILPYNIWVHHDFTSVRGLFNYTPGISSGNGWYDWNMGWNTATGRAPGVVGTGPFMLQNSYGIPEGAVTPSHYEKLYVNPHFFVQYTNASSGLRQYTPKIYELYYEYYSSESSMIAAYQKGEIDTTEGAPPASFLPQLESTPGSYIYHKTSSGYGYLEFNTRVSPLNVTAFRQALSYATPTAYIASTIDDGFGILSSDPINPTNILYYNSSAPEYSLNMAKAKSLIKSIPGMVNVSGTLEYYGKPVSLTIQTTVGSVAPSGIEDIDAISNYWSELGVKVVLKEEAFTTLISNLDGTISSSSNLYTIVALGASTASGYPGVDCQESLNPTYGISTYGYSGPFTSMTVNGKLLNSSQVQSLLDNYTNKLVSTDSLPTAEKLTKRLQVFIIREAVKDSLGYSEDLVPEQTNEFTNYSHTNQNEIGIYWEWQYLSIYKTHKVSIKYQYALSVKATVSTSTTQYDNETSTITFTVTNGTKPVSGATVLVGIDAPYGGIFNITSNTLTTNSKGQAIWKYEVKDLRTLLESTNSTGQIVHLKSESVNITGIAEIPNSNIIQPGNATVELTLSPNRPVTAISTLDYIIVGVVVAVIVIAGAAIFEIKRKQKRKT